MNYQDSNKVEALGRPQIVAHLESMGWTVVLFDGADESIVELQKVGDALLIKGEKSYAVDFKIEEKFTGNFFIEWWSNRNPFRPNPGWAAKPKSKYVLYFFLSTSGLYTLDLQKLRAYLLDGERWRAYTEVPQGKYHQLNITTGLLVPVVDLIESRVVVNHADLSEGAA